MKLQQGKQAAPEKTQVEKKSSGGVLI